MNKGSFIYYRKPGLVNGQRCTKPKKYTILNQKELVSGNTIFTRKKKYTIPLGRYIKKLMTVWILHGERGRWC